MRHGEAWLFFSEFAPEDDPHVGLVAADMDTWLDAHPCDCEDICTCPADMLFEEEA